MMRTTIMAYLIGLSWISQEGKCYFDLFKYPRLTDLSNSVKRVSGKMSLSTCRLLCDILISSRENFSTPLDFQIILMPCTEEIFMSLTSGFKYSNGS